MKKILLLVFLLIFGTQLFAQNADILGTWYVYKYSTAFGGEAPLPQTDPQIMPFITFIDSSGPDNMLGNTGCNTFTATISYGANEDYLVDSVDATQAGCEDPAANDLDELFHEFIGQGFQVSYLFYNENGEQKLLLNGMLESELYLQREPLSISDLSANSFKIYPNPVSEELFVSSEKIPIDKMSIYSMTGRKILEIKTTKNSVNVSKLSKGIYFLEINSGNKKSVQKFIKN